MQSQSGKSASYGAAMALAIVADTVLEAMPSPASQVIDIALAFVFSKMLGFHTALLPALGVEMLPVAGFVPTWTAAVAFIWMQDRRKR